MYVLIVEYDDLVRELLLEDLLDAGLDVVSVTTAEAGLHLVEGEAPHPAVLVTDVNLGPGMDGFALRDEARRRWPRVLVLTMTGNDQNVQRMTPEDRSLCFLKPFPTGTLVRAVAAFRSLHPERFGRGSGGFPSALIAAP